MIILRRADMSDKDIARFWTKVDKSCDCWTWQAGTNSQGYGKMRLRGKIVLAHRLAYALAYGECPAGLQTDHICHNTLCVNPAHLHLVTNQQNSENRVARKGSKSGIRGVCWDTARNKWRVYVEVKGKHYYGGRYNDIHEAEQAAIELRNKLMTNNILDRGKA
nr:MAG TPA: homing endonuclease [Caudoviricetes sp.]